MSKFTPNGMPSPLAQKLTKYLQTDDGTGFGVPKVAPNDGALAAHALAFLSNAAQLCWENPVHDFSVFGALYSLRHGLELWFKYLAQNNMMDRALLAIFDEDEAAATLDELASALQLLGKKKASQKTLLCLSLCALRNNWTDRLKFPAVWTENIGPDFAKRAIQEVRVNGGRGRREFTRFWCVPVPGHSLKRLWHDVRESFADLRPAVYRDAQRWGGKTVSLDEMQAVVDFLDYYDPDGDAFRYPASLTGKWYLHLPHVNLMRLGNLASRLEQTLTTYSALLDESYSLSTLRDPEPSPPTY